MKKESVKKIFKNELSFFLSVPPFVWVTMFFYIPLIVIIGRSFVLHDGVSWFPSLSLEHYKLFLGFAYFNVIKRSLVLAFTTASLSLLLAYPTAYFIARKVQKKWKNILLFLVMLPFSVNLLIQAYSWYFVLGQAGLLNNVLIKCGLIHEPLYMLNTPFAVFVVTLYCYLPLMILPLYAALEKIDVRFIEASLDLGATWWVTFLRVILPLSLPGIRTGFFLVFIPVFGEFVIPALLGGARHMYVGSLISYYFLTTRNLALGSAFTCLSSAVLLIISFVIYRRLQKVR